MAQSAQNPQYQQQFTAGQHIQYQNNGAQMHARTSASYGAGQTQENALQQMQMAFYNENMAAQTQEAAQQRYLWQQQQMQLQNQARHAHAQQQ